MNDCETCIHSTKEAEERPCAACEETADGWTKWEPDTGEIQEQETTFGVPAHERRCSTCLNSLVTLKESPCHLCNSSLNKWQQITDAGRCGLKPEPTELERLRTIEYNVKSIIDRWREGRRPDVSWGCEVLALLEIEKAVNL